MIFSKLSKRKKPVDYEFAVCYTDEFYELYDIITKETEDIPSSQQLYIYRKASEMLEKAANNATRTLIGTSPDDDEKLAALFEGQCVTVLFLHTCTCNVSDAGDMSYTFTLPVVWKNVEVKKCRNGILKCRKADPVSLDEVRFIANDGAASALDKIVGKQTGRPVPERFWRPWTFDQK